MSSTTHSNIYAWNGVNFAKTHQTTAGELKVSVENTDPIAVTGSFTADISGQTVNVGNFPATQPVSGSVSVSNFPATQPVSGSVTVSNNTDPATATKQDAQTAQLTTIAGDTTSMDGKITACDTGNIAGSVTVSNNTDPATGTKQDAQTAHLSTIAGSNYIEGASIGASNTGVLMMGRNGSNAAKPIHITNNGDVEVEIADFVKGQATSANSFPVVISSDQSSVATNPVTDRTSQTAFNAQVIADAGSATSSSIDLQGYKYIQVLGNTNNTTDAVATFEWSVDNVTFYVSDDEFIPQNFSTGDFSFILPNAVARYVRFSKSNTSGASETITLIVALRKN